MAKKAIGSGLWSAIVSALDSNFTELYESKVSPVVDNGTFTFLYDGNTLAEQEGNVRFSITDDSNISVERYDSSQADGEEWVLFDTIGEADVRDNSIDGIVYYIDKDGLDITDGSEPRIDVSPRLSYTKIASVPSFKHGQWVEINCELENTLKPIPEWFFQTIMVVPKGTDVSLFLYDDILAQGYLTGYRSIGRVGVTSVNASSSVRVAFRDNNSSTVAATGSQICGGILGRAICNFAYDGVESTFIEGSTTTYNYGTDGVPTSYGPCYEVGNLDQDSQPYDIYSCIFAREDSGYLDLDLADAVTRIKNFAVTKVDKMKALQQKL